MKRVINWIIDQELESLDDYPALAEPMSKEFDLSVESCTDVLNTVMEWETDSNTIESLDTVLNKKYHNFIF